MSLDDSTEFSRGDQLLLRVDRGVFQLEKLFNITSGFVIMALMMLAVMQVFGRKIFNFPVPGYVDWVESAMAVFAFLGIAYCQRLGGHVRMELLIGRFVGRPRWVLETLSTLIALFIITVLSWYAYEHFLRAWLIGDSSMDIELPIWPGKIIVVIAFISLIGRLVIQLVGFLRLVAYPDAVPIAIPLIATVDEVAQHEIDVGLAGEEEKVVIVPGRAEQA